MTDVEFHHGDNREVLRRLIDAGVRVDSCVTDPPYGLTSITKRFGKEGAAPAKFGSDGAFARAGAGFMNQSWDGSGIERDPEFWRLVFDILLPGGFCMAFSSPRTGHWQAVAMEQAGFIMHPFITWAYGQGFPKAHAADKAIDRELAVEGTKVAIGEPVRRPRPGADQHRTGDWEKLEDRVYQPGQYVPGSPEAAEWEGWAYGAQTLKPAVEPIYVGQKPFSEKNGALNLLKHGVGAMNIDGCRVGTTGATKRGSQAPYALTEDGREDRSENWARTGHEIIALNLGRHPANLVHDGSAEVVALFPQSAGQLASVGPANGPKGALHTYGEYGPRSQTNPRGDDGSAARFFNALPYAANDDGPIRYQAKASKADRAGSAHPTVKPIELMRWLCRLVTPPGGTVLDPFAGSGTTGAAALLEGFRPILIEMHDQYADDIRRRFDLNHDFFTLSEWLAVVG